MQNRVKSRDAGIIVKVKKEKEEKKGAKKATTQQAVSVPRVFTSIYLKVITSYYAHILLIAILLYFDRIIQDSKLTKQKYVYI